MTKCLVCGKDILTQKQWWIEKCEKAVTPGSSHEIKKNELVKLHKARE